MKKWEAKTVLLLALPALVLVVFASILSLRAIKRNLGPPYVITKYHLLVGFDALTDEQKGLIKSHNLGLKPQNYVVYEVEVTSKSSSWSEKWIWGDSHAVVGNVSCIASKSGWVVPLVSTIAINGMGLSRVDEFYDLTTLKKFGGNIEFSIPLSWTRDGRKFTRKLTKKILPANLKQGTH